VYQIGFCLLGLCPLAVRPRGFPSLPVALRKTRLSKIFALGFFASGRFRFCKGANVFKDAGPSTGEPKTLE
jgi:hypothetical protein